jgi:hypothetical protein
MPLCLIGYLFGHVILNRSQLSYERVSKELRGFVLKNRALRRYLEPALEIPHSAREGR